MFGFGLKSKAKRVLRAEFFYKGSFMNNSTFNIICQQGDRVGQNEYSVAIFYILAKMNLLVEKIRSYQDYEYFAEDRSGMHAFDRIRGNYNEAEYFIGFHGSILNRIIYQANSSKSEINSMMNEINLIWDENEVELRVAEIHKEDKERSVSTSKAAALMMAHSQLAYELIEEKYEDMLRNLSFEEIVRRIGINIDEMKFIDAQYSDEIHGHETNLRGKGMLRSKNSDNDNKFENEQEIIFSNKTRQVDDNPFPESENEIDSLVKKIFPFSLCITMSQIFLKDELKNKDLNISEIEAATLRSFQLLGALDYIAQGENIGVEELIESFLLVVKDEPYDISPDVSGKILTLISNRTSDIVNIQINGANLLEKIYELTPKGGEKFSSGIIKIGQENASELANLVTKPLILEIREILNEN